MRTFIVLVLLVVAGIAGYLYQENQKQAEQALNQPLNQPRIQPDELSKIAAQRHIDNLTPAPENVIPIEQANHFVSKDQLLKIPAAKAITQATTEVISDGNASSFGVQLEKIGQQNSSQSKTQDMIINGAQLALADQIKLQELLNDPDDTSGKLFYIHGVTNSDRQGLWGIIQSGLIHTFAQGIQLDSSLISATIPKSADERLTNSTSSFLGAILDRKVKDTYVYNFEKGILGRNPDLINPGQELIIVTFTNAELISIYNHFANQ